MTQSSQPAILCCPLRLPLSAPNHRQGSLERCVAWIELTAPQAHKLARKVQTLHELEEKGIFKQSRLRESAHNFRVFPLPRREEMDDDDPALLELMKMFPARKTSGESFRNPRERQLPPGFPVPDALKMHELFALPQRRAVDRGAIIWEVRWDKGCWYHTMAVQDWRLQKLAQKQQIFTAEGEQQGEAFNQLIEEDTDLAIEMLEEAIQLWRATDREHFLLDGLGGQHIAHLLSHIQPQTRNRLTRILAHLPNLSLPEKTSPQPPGRH